MLLSVFLAYAADAVLNITYGLPGHRPDIDWYHPLIAFPAYKQRQIGPDHVGMLFFDSENEPTAGLDMGDEEIADAIIRLKSDDAKLDDDDRMRIKVTRPSGADLFDLSYGSVILGETLSEITMLLPTKYVYGLGGHDFSFGVQEAAQFKSKTLYNMEHVAKEGGQNSLPVFVAMDSERNYFGVHLETDRPLTIEVLPGINVTKREFKPLVAFRSMGGHMLFHLFSGPTPHDVTRQISNHLGRLQKMPPLWAMGYHVCRNTPDRQSFETSVANMTDLAIPFDSDCLDEMLFPTAFTHDDKNFPFPADDSQLLYDLGKVMVPSQHVQVDTADAADHTFFIKAQVAEDGNFEGVFNGKNVTLPDFTDPNVSAWWSSSLADMAALLAPGLGRTPGLAGLTFAHNSPFVKLNYNPCNLSSTTYIPTDIASVIGSNTICPNAVHYGEIDHLSLHNSYPQRQLQATMDAVRDESLPIETFLFTKHYGVGVAGIGGVYGSDFAPTWDNMRKSLKEVLDLGMSGFPLVSMTACGVEAYQLLNTTESLDDLCLRWYQVYRSE
jgi:lysosomal alpha-glucosidase